MGYTNRRDTFNWWYPNNKKLKYCSSEKFDENNNKFGKGWSPGYGIMLGTNNSTLPTLKLTHNIITSSKMIYSKPISIYYKEVLPLLL